MAHRWEDLIDFPWAKIYFEVSVDILDHNAAERMAGMCVCVMLKNRSNKRPPQEKVGCLAHCVWDVNYLYVFYFGWSGKILSLLRLGLQCEK